MQLKQQLQILKQNRNNKSMRQAITISEAALEQVRALLQKREKHALDECIVVDDVTILIDPKAIMFLIGTEMDFVTDKFQSGFVFNNPNEKGRCGCGKSFHV
jgi:iron-sulfur cluster assembly protein